MPGDRIDDLARVLARPIPRRGMLRMSAGVLAGAAVAPGVLAQRAAAQGRPKNCQEYCASGTPCPPDRPSCCCVDSSETAGAWVVPIGGACYSRRRAICCPVKRPDGSSSVVYCDAGRAKCGEGGGGPNCVCLVQCGEECCDASKEECGKRRGVCLDLCVTGDSRDEYVCCAPPFVADGSGVCVCAGRDRCGSGCCAPGYTCIDYGVGTTCLGPPDSAGFPSLQAPEIGGFAYAYGRGAGARAAARSTPFVLAIAAVGAQASAALAAFRAPERDRAFRRRVKAPRAAVTVSDLSGDAKAAVTRMLQAEARANAQLLAAGRARGRALGALKAKSRSRAAQHSKDSGRFAAAAAKGYARLPAKRAAAARALRAAGVAEIEISVEQAVAARERFAAGLPPDLARAMSSLGLDKADRGRARERLAQVRPGTVAGPALIAPLEDPAVAQEYARLAKALRAYATKARREPLRRKSPLTRPVARRRES